MRKLVLSLAAAGAALVVASPAAAQYYPQPQPQQYGNGYGYSGYNNGYGRGDYGRARSLQVRIDSVQRQIRVLDRKDVIGDRSADRLRDEAGHLESQFHHAMRNGLNGYEANNIEQRLAELERRVQFATQNRYGRYDRDHDGYHRD
jgi:hypothetical protein